MELVLLYMWRILRSKSNQKRKEKKKKKITKKRKIICCCPFWLILIVHLQGKFFKTKVEDFVSVRGELISSICMNGSLWSYLVLDSFFFFFYIFLKKKKYKKNNEDMLVIHDFKKDYKKHLKWPIFKNIKLLFFSFFFFFFFFNFVLKNYENKKYTIQENMFLWINKLNITIYYFSSKCRSPPLSTKWKSHHFLYEGFLILETTINKYQQIKLKWLYIRHININSKKLSYIVIYSFSTKNFCSFLLPKKIFFFSYRF